MFYEDIWNYKDAIKVFKILFWQPHILNEGIFKNSLKVTDTVMDVVILGDIQISILNGISLNVFFIFMES